MPRGTGQARELIVPLAGLLTLPAHCDATPPTLIDGADTALTVDTAGNVRVTVLGPSGGVQVVNVNGIADSLTAVGTVVTPGAAGTIVSLAAVPTGVYDVTCIVGYGAVGDLPNNMKFFVGGVAVGNGLAVDPGATSAAIATRFPRVTITGPATLTIQSIAAGAAGCVYYGSIIVTRLS